RRIGVPGLVPQPPQPAAGGGGGGARLVVERRAEGAGEGRDEQARARPHRARPPPDAGERDARGAAPQDLAQGAPAQDEGAEPAGARRGLVLRVRLARLLSSALALALALLAACRGK